VTRSRRGTLRERMPAGDGADVGQGDPRGVHSHKNDPRGPAGWGGRSGICTTPLARLARSFSQTRWRKGIRFFGGSGEHTSGHFLRGVWSARFSARPTVFGPAGEPVAGGASRGSFHEGSGQLDRFGRGGWPQRVTGGLDAQVRSSRALILLDDVGKAARRVGRFVPRRPVRRLEAGNKRLCDGRTP